MTAPFPSHLEPSELGTKEYWDEYYSANLSSTPSPTASLDGWFSDVGATQKILEYLSNSRLNLDIASTTFLDLGTGNGEMLFLLREEGKFQGQMLGVDYSQPSIDLARKIAFAKNQLPTDGLSFEVWDIMHQRHRSEWTEAFDIVLDKGTFDAISLSDEKGEDGRRVCETYGAKVEHLVKPGGFLLLTSCNWTELELKTWIEKDDVKLRRADSISYPSFSFGGQTGQSISTVCFTKISS